MTSGIRIDSLAHGGKGVGRTPDGKVCFVPYTAPGDLVSVRTVREKRGYREGEILTLESPSPLRVPPRCPRFARCGGCHWQHIDYDAQIGWKRRILERFLSRLVPREAPEIEVAPAPLPWGYRHRAQFKLRFVEGRLLLGFHAAGTHRVVPLPDEGCPILTPELNGAAALMKEIVAASPHPDAVPQVDISHGDGAGGVVVVHLLDRAGDRMVSRLLDSFRSHAPGWSLMLQRGRKNSLALLQGDGALSYRIAEGEGSPSLLVTGGGFFQGNLSQNRFMISTVARMIEAVRPSAILDLFCGNGNFSLAASGRSVRVTGVEEYEGSILDARQNGALLGFEPELIVGDASEAVDRFVAQGRRFDMVIVDPPRTGALGAFARIPGLDPSAVVSISCDPATQARDLRMLVNAGYRPERIVMVDLFPQTFHIESIVLLRRG